VAAPNGGICAVVPAAGRGSRLGLQGPKLLAPVGDGATIWSVLSQKLLAVADHINLIVSPDGFAPIDEAIDQLGQRGCVTMSVQPAPSGMGDAIFCGYPIWSASATILIVWGDQVFVSIETLRRTCALHRGAPRRLVIPVVRLAEPYVEYLFDREGRLTGVRQSREGDACAADGYGDIGTFALSTDGLRDAWDDYLCGASAGAATGESNFLPFMPYLATRGWDVERCEISDAREARGINTPADLAFFQSLLQQSRKEQAAQVGQVWKVGQR
jgi:bifunctional UDP-N-acetylglucosamine pyrophosphorylase/glucosamine-1-phosphate N-acetyltransferase